MSLRFETQWSLKVGATGVKETDLIHQLLKARGSLPFRKLVGVGVTAVSHITCFIVTSQGWGGAMTGFEVPVSACQSPQGATVNDVR